MLTVSGSPYSLSETLEFDHQMTIVAETPGAVVLRAAGPFRVMRISRKADVTLEGLNITEGTASCSYQRETSGIRAQAAAHCLLCR